jgi:hypothetical protein
VGVRKSLFTLLFLPPFSFSVSKDVEIEPDSQTLHSKLYSYARSYFSGSHLHLSYRRYISSTTIVHTTHLASRPLRIRVEGRWMLWFEGLCWG